MKNFICALLLIVSTVALAQSPSMSFSFTVPPGPDAYTSAAVFNSSGAMVRVLWGGISYPPGTYQKVWDGNLQNGSAATASSTYQIRVLIDNVVLTYDRGIGSTEKALYTSNRYGAFTWQQGANLITYAFVGGTGWVSTGYSEGTYNIGYFTDPNYIQPVNLNYQQNGVNFVDIATDGTWVYLASVGGSNVGPSFVTALDANSGLPAYFTSGTLFTGNTCAGFPRTGNNSCFNANNAWPNMTVSMIDQAAANAPVPTGIAVQRSGNILAVAQGANLINLFDKTAGTSLGTITSIASPTWMAFNSEGLWVVSGGGLYLVTGLPSSPVVTQPITGFSNVASVATNGATGSIFVLDGGTHEQMYEYAVTTHTLMRTYGTLGGYSGCDPTITNTKFMFDGLYATGNQSTTYRSWIRVQDTDDVWILDGGNQMRILHISPSNTYVGRVLFMKPSYVMATSETQPTRIFHNLTEYSVNYTLPLLPGDPDPAAGGNGAWAMVRNWAACGGGTYQTPNLTYSTVWSSELLSNGSAYMTVTGSDGHFHLAQLPPSGTSPMRITTADIQTLHPQLLRDGSLIYTTSSGSPPTTTTTFLRAPLTGFDGSGNPQWGSYVQVQQATTTSTNPFLVPFGSLPWHGSEPSTDGYYPVWTTVPYTANYNLTSVANSSGGNAVYQGSSITGGCYGVSFVVAGFTNTSNNGTFLCVSSNGSSITLQNASAVAETHAATAVGTGAGLPHVGGITGNAYSWAALPELCSNFPSTGTFPCGQSFGGANGVNPVRAEGKLFIVGYNGQSASWGNQYWVFYEDGMMVVQFGQVNPFPCNATVGGGTVPIQNASCGYNYADTATNVNSWATTTYNGDLYLYHGDEGGYAPFHRWHVGNLASIHEFSGFGILTVNGAASPLAQLF